MRNPIDPGTRTFIATAEKLYRDHRNDIAFDFSPILIDFGPVVGPNVAFFGEQLGCKLFIEDLAADIERHTRAGTRDALPDALSKRFPKGDATVDGVLCWDISAPAGP